MSSQDHEYVKDMAVKVYQRLLQQGRPEPQARRDAEAWVLGNLGVRITLPEPEPNPEPNRPAFEYQSSKTSGTGSLLDLAWEQAKAQRRRGERIDVEVTVTDGLFGDGFLKDDTTL